MDDEIDLREYVQVLWHARYVIIGLTLMASLVAFAVSRFVLPTVYEASTLVVVEAPAGLERGEVRVRLRGDGSLAPSIESLCIVLHWVCRQQPKGGDPVSHCLIPRSSGLVTWILAFDGVRAA